MKKKWIVLLVLAGGAYGGYRYWNARKSTATGPAFREVKVERGDIRQTILATGVVEPQNRVEINSPVAGRLEDVLVQEGDLVKKGQTVAWVSSSERATLLDAARARGADVLKRWEELYKPAPLIAPLDGQVIARRLEPGQSIGPDKAVLVLSDRLIVNAKVDETDMAQIRPQQDAEITLDAYPQRPIPAAVERIAYEAKMENNVTVYQVDVLPRDVPDFMRSGMSASVSFQRAGTNGVLVLPAEAVLLDGPRAIVLRPAALPGAPPGTNEVVTGLDDGQRVQIVSGVEEGATVLVPDLQLAATDADGKPRTGSPLIPFGRMPPRKR
jgi:membrane fusion protein, macrolide-specific efflux system